MLTGGSATPLPGWRPPEGRFPAITAGMQAPEILCGAPGCVAALVCTVWIAFAARAPELEPGRGYASSYR